MLLDIQERTIEPDITVVDVAGKLALGRESLRLEQITERLLKENHLKVIVDLSRLEYIDSAGIGLIAMSSGKMREAGGRMAVVVPEGRVLHALETTLITAIVTVVKSVDAAIAQVNAHPASA
jgi:anti-anti-sigma factor